MVTVPDIKGMFRASEARKPRNASQDLFAFLWTPATIAKHRAMTFPMYERIVSEVPRYPVFIELPMVKVVPVLELHPADAFQSSIISKG